MSKKQYIPPCMADAPPEIIALAEHLAKAVANSLRETIREEIPKTGIQELNDLARGVFLMAAEKCRALTI